MIGFLLSAVKIIFLLGFLIIIHEGGHFLVAKLCNIKVNEFAIGFGPTIWKKQGKETKYALRLIPLGGFVSMEGEEKRAEDERAFNNASIPKRIAVVVAGAVINIIFGILLYFIITSTTTTHISTTIESVNTNGIDSVLQAGDKIVKVNNKNIRTKTNLNEAMQEFKGGELDVVVERDGNKIELNPTPMEVPVKLTGIYLSAKEKGDNATKIIQIDKDSSAEKQGLKVNDVIKAVNGEEVIGNQEKVIEIINKESEKIEFLVDRQDEEIKIEVVPETVSKYYLGITLEQANDSLIEKLYYGFFETGDFLKSVLDSLKMMFKGEVGVDQMVGPVGLSSIVSKTNGIIEYLNMIALISLSLGITNLLPIPALDGGKLLILILEAIRRKPLKEETEIKIQLLGFAILMTLTIVVTYKDIINIV